MTTTPKYVLTEEHRAQLAPWADRWIAIARRTEPQSEEDRAITRRAIVGIYTAAKLAAPVVVHVTSPLAGVFAAGFAEASRASRKPLPIVPRGLGVFGDGVVDAVMESLGLDPSTRPDGPDRSTTRDLSRWYSLGGSPRAIADALGVGRAGLDAASAARDGQQGGNQWAAWAAHLSFFRHVAKIGETHGVDYSAWAHWEDAAIHSGPRYLTPSACFVSDFPSTLTVDEQHRPHGATGPFCAWRDGVALYSWHGVRIPGEWIEQRETIDARVILGAANIEHRRAGIELIGWRRVLDAIDARVIDRDRDPEIGTLYEGTIPGVGVSRFLRVLCGTKREFVLSVPPTVATAKAANAWTYGIEAKDLRIQRRT